MVLAQDEIDACREAFLAFDKDRCVAVLPPSCPGLSRRNF